MFCVIQRTELHFVALNVVNQLPHFCDNVCTNECQLFINFSRPMSCLLRRRWDKDVTESRNTWIETYCQDRVFWVHIATSSKIHIASNIEDENLPVNGQKPTRIGHFINTCIWCRFCSIHFRILGFYWFGFLRCRPAEMQMVTARVCTATCALFFRYTISQSATHTRTPPHMSSPWNFLIYLKVEKKSRKSADKNDRLKCARWRELVSCEERFFSLHSVLLLWFEFSFFSSVDFTLV